MGMQLLLCYSKPEVNPALGVLLLTLQRLASDVGGHFSKVMNDTDCISCVVVMPNETSCRAFYKALCEAVFPLPNPPDSYDDFIESCLCYQ